jgi:hypothetical protein
MFSKTVPQGRPKTGSLTTSSRKVVWQTVHGPSVRQTAPGGGVGSSVLGSTIGPAIAGAVIQIRAQPASAATAATKCLRIALLLPLGLDTVELRKRRVVAKRG